MISSLTRKFIMSQPTTIIVSVKNTLAWTKKCLESIKDYTDLTIHELIIINNGSSSQTTDFLKTFQNNLVKNNNNCKLIGNNRNLGSYITWNKAIKESTNKYCCIVHTDCLVTKDWLEKLVIFLESKDAIDLNIKCVSPCTNYSGEHEFIIDKEHMDLYTSIKFPNKKEIVEADLNKLISTFYPDGINEFAQLVNDNKPEGFIISSQMSTYCLMFDRQTLIDYGLFDEDFFPHCFGEKPLKYYLSINDVLTACLYTTYVHHNGNTTSDGIDMCFPELSNKNTKILEEKMMKIYEKNMTKPSDIIQTNNTFNVNNLFIDYGKTLVEIKIDNNNDLLLSDESMDRELSANKEIKLSFDNLFSIGDNRNILNIKGHNNSLLINSQIMECLDNEESWIQLTVKHEDYCKEIECNSGIIIKYSIDNDFVAQDNPNSPITEVALSIVSDTQEFEFFKIFTIR